MPRCSVIIPVFNNAVLTQQCINTLLAIPTNVAFEVIVVDDGSTDGTQPLLRSYGDRIRVLTQERNKGFAHACNRGASAALGEYLVFLNNDTIPFRNWLDAMTEYADAHPQAAAVGSKLLFPNGTIQHAGVVICQDKFPRHLYAGFPGDHAAVNKSRAFQVVTAACVLVRRTAFESVDGFDPLFMNGYEDVDLCLRLGERGHEIHYCHQSVLYHLESVSPGRFEHCQHNTVEFVRRWAHRLRPDDLTYYLEDGLFEITYAHCYPNRFRVDPLLATVSDDERLRGVEELLLVRAHQVDHLLREALVRYARRTPPELPRATDFPTAQEYQQVCQGTRRALGSRHSERLVSILMPTKNRSEMLRTLLPSIREQRSSCDVELIAVDSGSHDDTVEQLRAAGATVLAIDPLTFDHGLTCNLAARQAKGDVLVFLNQSALPADEHWLSGLLELLDSDPSIAGVCSRVLPRKDANCLEAKDANADVSGSPERSVRGISDAAEYRALTHQQRRLLLNFHSVSAAVRSSVFARIPFRKIASGEDLQWAKEVLEAGFKIGHEPSSVVLHSHEYSYLEILQRNVDDGMANQEIVGRSFADEDVLPSILGHARDDWRHLEQIFTDPAELENWKLASVMRRTAQAMGQWIGVNGARMPFNVASFVSLTDHVKRGVGAAKLGRF